MNAVLFRGRIVRIHCRSVSRPAVAPKASDARLIRPTLDDLSLGWRPGNESLAPPWPPGWLDTAKTTVEGR
jgi:hypothetical protein